MRSATRARARRHGVMTHYRGADGARHAVDEEVVLAVLDAVGPDASEPPLLDPVSVAWDDDRPRLRANASVTAAMLAGADVTLQSDTGEQQTLRVADGTIAPRAPDALDVTLPFALAPGARVTAWVKPRTLSTTVPVHVNSSLSFVILSS